MPSCKQHHSHFSECCYLCALGVQPSSEITPTPGLHLCRCQLSAASNSPTATCSLRPSDVFCTAQLHQKPFIATKTLQRARCCWRRPPRCCHSQPAAHLEQVPGQVCLCECKRATACTDLHGLCLCSDCVHCACPTAGTDDCPLCKAPAQHTGSTANWRSAAWVASMQCANNSTALYVLFCAVECTSPELLSLKALHLAVLLLVVQSVNSEEAGERANTIKQKG